MGGFRSFNKYPFRVSSGNWRIYRNEIPFNYRWSYYGDDHLNNGVGLFDNESYSIMTYNFVEALSWCYKSYNIFQFGRGIIWHCTPSFSIPVSALDLLRDVETFLFKLEKEEEEFREHLFFDDEMSYLNGYYKLLALPMSMRFEKQDAKVGYIYLAKMNAPQPIYKIGHSIDPDRRKSEFAIRPPYPITLVHTHKTENMLDDEKYWHTLFEDKNTNGEWYELDDDDIERFVTINGNL